MYQPGQHSHSLFPGVNSDNLKTFVLEVDCYHLEDALKAMENALMKLKIGGVFQKSGILNCGMKVKYSYTYRPHHGMMRPDWDSTLSDRCPDVSW
ncbi:hypothetical protein CQX38_03315 [Salmonella enterica]|nr:hypothetical protein [Salmonella enterica]